MIFNINDSFFCIIDEVETLTAIRGRIRWEDLGASLVWRFGPGEGHRDNFTAEKRSCYRLRVGNPVKIRSCPATVWGVLPLRFFHGEMAKR